MQRRRHSLMETLLSTAIGFAVALLTQLLVFPLLGKPFTFGENLLLSSIFTAVSIIRGYAVRRLFNHLHVKGILK